MSKNLPKAAFAPAALTITLSLFPPDAAAYLDPSTGSMVVTALVGIFASIALALKTYWYKFKNLFRRSGRQMTAADKETSSDNS